jgi:hypothetical protein
VRDRFGIFGTVTRFRELSLLLVMMLRIPNRGAGARGQLGHASAGGWMVHDGGLWTVGRGAAGPPVHGRPPSGAGRARARRVLGRGGAMAAAGEVASMAPQGEAEAAEGTGEIGTALRARWRAHLGEGTMARRWPTAGGFQRDGSGAELDELGLRLRLCVGARAGEAEAYL